MNFNLDLFKIIPVAIIFATHGQEKRKIKRDPPFQTSGFKPREVQDQML